MRKFRSILALSIALMLAMGTLYVGGICPQAAKAEAGYEVLDQIPDISTLDYEISYQSAGEGALAVEDGVFQLEIQHTADQMTCITAEGAESLPLGDGEYNLSVRSGILEVTRNGHFEASYLLPISEADSPSVRAKGLEDVAVKLPENREVYYAGRGKTEFTTQDVSQNWSLEFEKDDKEDELIEVSDGSYYLKLFMHDYIVGFSAPLGGTVGQSEQLCRLPEGRHLYRVTSVRGIATLFIDNQWAGSLRLPTSAPSPRVMRTMVSDDSLTIWRTEADEWTFAEDFEDTKSLQPADYWLGDADMTFSSDDTGSYMTVKNGSALLNGFLKDAEVTAKVKISSASGNVGFIGRHHSDIVKMFAGYDVKSGRWVIQRSYGFEKRTYAKADGELPEGEWMDLTLKMKDKTASLLVNGEEVVSADNMDYTVHGRVGICAEGDSEVEVDSIRVTGDGRVTGGVCESSYLNITCATFLEMNDGSVVMSARLRSTDQGRTFVEDSVPAISENTIRLQNGEILAVRRSKAGQATTYWFDAYVSADDGKTFSGPYRMTTIERNRITMQDKLMQMKSGRIIFCGGESGDGKEDYGNMCVYYSDDNGRTWSTSKEEISIFNTGVNVQEGVVTELPDGTLRLYMRTERGFIYYTDSKDGGETWDMEVKPTAFPAVMCALNIIRDPWEEETYYMIWEYDNKNVDTKAQYPRNRVSLAVSYDGCENWEYAMDLNAADMFLKGKNTTIGHMNEGVRVFEDYILADVCVTTTGNRFYVWRIDKDKIRTQKRFPMPYLQY